MQGQQSRLRPPISGQWRSGYHCPFAGKRMFFFHSSLIAHRTYYLNSQCGPMPFARVAQHQIHQSNLSSRANEPPVHQLGLDTNFTAAGSSQCVLSPHPKCGRAHKDLFFCNRDGDVHFSVLGANVKGIPNSGTQAPSRRGYRSLSSSRSDIHQRNFFTNALNGM